MAILLIDSNAAKRGQTAAFLEQEGHRVIQTAGTAHAADLIRQERIRIVIFTGDIQESDGAELCRCIRDLKNEYYTYFVVVADKEDPEGLRLGVDAYLTDPLDFEKLAALVQVGKRISGFTAPLSSDEALKENETGRKVAGDEKTSSRKTGSEGRKKNGILKEDVSRYDILFARTALEINLLTKEDLAKAFSYQKKQRRSGKVPFICEVFSDLKMLSENRVEKLRSIIKTNLEKKFGFAALKKGLITREQLNRALDEQTRQFKETQSCRLTGDILVDLGAITAEQRDALRHEMKSAGPVEKKAHVSSGRLPKLKEIPSKDPQSVLNLKVTVCEDDMEARILLSEGADAGGAVTQEDVLEAIGNSGLKYGLTSSEEIRRFILSKPVSGSSLVVAKGRPLVPGCDADIIYHFDIDFLKAGEIKDDGSIDYRERGKIPRVNAGDLLATKNPMKPGSPGVDVFGNPVLVPQAQDIDFKCGTGTLLSEDGMQVFSAVDGRPDLSLSGMLCVFTELVIDRDVDFKTGNIDFDGNVRVKGAVMKGFSVKCNHLTAGEIDHAKIFAKGDVIVQGGIIDSDIMAEGIVKAKFIIDSNIKSFGDVKVGREIFNSKIRSSGRFSAESGRVVCSFVSAKMGFISKEVGTDISLPCRIHVGLDENVKKRVQSCDYLLADKKRDLEILQKQYEKKVKRQGLIHQRLSVLAQNHESQISAGRPTVDDHAQEIDRYFHEQERLDAEIERYFADIESLIAGIEAVSEEKKIIREWSRKQNGCPVVTVRKKILQGTKIFGMHASTILRQTLSGVTIKEARQTDSDIWIMSVGEIDISA